jgi:hypothetical protein
MRGTVAKRLRRQAKNEVDKKKDERIIYHTVKGERFLTVDCFRGRYQALKKMYRYAKQFYKEMPELRITNAPKDNDDGKGLDLPWMRELLDFP